MQRAIVLGGLGLLLLGSAGAAQDENVVDARIGASQIEAPDPDSQRRIPASKAYLDTPAAESPAPPRASLTRAPDDGAARAAPNPAANQISNPGQGGSGVPQLSKADLEASLAQLSPVERRVLLQAIEGSDICENPPQVAAIIALCQTRLETRSQEFAAMEAPSLSAEERLLRGDFDNNAVPSVAQVITRLARTSAASDDFSNQAIASIALAPPPAPDQPADGDPGEVPGLGEQTQALINAIINQLGGGAP